MLNTCTFVIRLGSSLCALKTSTPHVPEMPCEHPGGVGSFLPTAQMGEQVSFCPRGPVIFRETLEEADKMARVPSDPHFPHALGQPLLPAGCPEALWWYFCLHGQKCLGTEKALSL